ncbi:histone acetyltransferase [Thraustotheca clavata]|uniref:histone acetyltransferase n=1 Tax=Thraustotheca clavata TaxID=74557 RepID=A0A1V9YSB9_9STRA|nr:histone acetyltransferase [Thraustotheca clavata]
MRVQSPQQVPTTPATVSTTWQSPNDNPIRREVITRIVHFLQSQKPNAPPDWMRRLPQMAKKLEESLYRNASSKQEYMDTSTLKQRLQVVARSFHTIKQQAAASTSTPQTPQQPPNAPNAVQIFRQRAAQIASTVVPQAAAQYHQRVLHMMNSPDQFRPVLLKQLQRLLHLRHALWCQLEKCTIAECPEMKNLMTHISSCTNSNQCPFNHCVSSKYVLSHFTQCTHAQCLVCQLARINGEAKDGNGQLIIDPVQAFAQLRAMQQAKQNAQNAQPQLNGEMTPPLKRKMSQISLDLNGTTPQAPATPMQSLLASTAAPQNVPSQIVQQPTMIPNQANVMQAAMMPQNPVNGLASQGGMMAAQATMMPAQATMIPAQVSMINQRQSAMMPGQPAVMVNSVAAMQQQQMVMQQQQRIAMLQKQFSEWSVDQLMKHSKKLEALAETLRSQMQRTTSEMSTNMETYKSTMDPTVKQRCENDVMEAQKHLRDLKSKYGYCSMQYKMVAHILKSRNASMPTPANPQNPPVTTPQPQPTPPLMSTPPSATTTVATPPESTSPPPVAAPEPAAKKIKMENENAKAAQPDAEVSLESQESNASATYMLPQMTDSEIRAHINSLQSQHCASLPVAVLKKKLEVLLRRMMEHKFGWVFSTPVDPVLLNIPNYFDIIRRPMDFGTIKKKLDANIYKHIIPFAADVRLTYRNAMTYNNEDTEVHQLAKDMLNDFNNEFAALEKESLVFEPAVLYCNGECNTRIRRNCYFFCSKDNKYHCCTACYPNLPQSIASTSNDGGSYNKNELERKKNDDVHEEPWVQCDHCNLWVHQICALFHHKPASDTSEKSTLNAPFHCPECLLQLRAQKPTEHPVEKKANAAKHLPRSKLSDFLERRVQLLLKKEFEEDAKWNRDKKTVFGMDPATAADKLIIRQVSNIEKQLIVRDKMYDRYKDQQYPSEHRFKSKCLCMFQETHGVSVLLFGMYVHEFDQQESDSNARRVYISYLDSVNFLEPVHLRTKVYHEILIGYLEFVKQRGFHTAHIWACPPLKGDDYILYCHPESQKTPKSDRLRQWYIQMLLKAKEEGIAVDINNMYDEYWCQSSASPMSLPYFEGDYWVGLAEDLIDKLNEEEKAVKSKAKPSKQNKLSKPNKRQGKEKDKSSEEVIEFTDTLMGKLGEVIKPMKEDFLVVKLFPCCKQCKKVVGAGTVWKESKPPSTTSTKTPTPATGVSPLTICDACYQTQLTSPSSNISWSDSSLIPTTLALVLKDKCIDPDEILESEVFDTRQAFLSLCQSNHYQFDDLRRAKHSSMMTLYHIGQPPNGYVYTCNQCSADITAGTRWHCNTCPDFDLCEACNNKKSQVHPHILEPIGTVNDAMQKARKERAKSIALHMQLLVHASSCNAENDDCTSLNCGKMKELMRHGVNCTKRATGGCTICRRVWALLQIHARQCRDNNCTVPRCKDLREHLRKLALQQQLMDDRRRAAVTEQYRQLNAEEKPAT